jgi:HSP20 family protein
MTVIRHSSPWGTWRQAASQLFDESAFRPIARSHREPRSLPLDITTNDDAVTVEAALPGVRPEDVELTIHENALTISVKENAVGEAAEGDHVYREVRRSHGSRTLRLPNGMDTDNATATFENGMLRLAIPRAEAAKPRQIPVTVVTEAPVPVASESGTTEAEAESEKADQA